MRVTRHIIDNRAATKMNQIYRLVPAATGAWAILASSQPAHATSPVLNLSTGLTGWTTQGDVTVTNTTVPLNLDGTSFSLTPATGQNMAQIVPSGAAAPVDALLGLSALSIENLLNNSTGSVTDFGVLTQTLTLTAGTYSFAWAYAANDYQPYNDGVMFSLVGGGSQTIISLARNGSSPTDTSGPSPGTLILGSYGSTAWETTTFTVANPGSYQIGFASYNWIDTSLNPELFVSAIPGTYTGTPVITSGGAPSTIFDTTSGDISASVFNTASTAYAQTALEFAGGTLQFSADTSTSKNVTLDSAGGILDTNGNMVMLTGVVSGAGALTKIGAGNLQLSGVNDFTGLTTISAGTLSLSGAGSIADSSGVVDNGTLDISATTAGASITTLSGTGIVALGAQTLTLTNAIGAFSGAVGGTGGLTLAGGAESLSGTNTYSGGTSIANGATLTLTGTGSVANSSGLSDNGTFNISATTAGAAVRSLSGNGTVTLGSNILTLTAASGGFGGVAGGLGGLAVTGGSEVLSGTNTYAGGTSIGSGATLALSGTGSVASSAGVADNGTFDISATSAGASVRSLSGSGTVNLGAQTLTLTNAADTFAGGIAGAGALAISGGTETLTGSSNYQGGTTISGGGTAVIAADAALGAAGGVLNLSGGTLATTATITTARDLTLTGNGTFDTSAATELTDLTGNVSGSGTLIKSGGGTLTLCGAVGNTGGTSVMAGVLNLCGNDTATGSTAVASGATLALSATGSVADASAVVVNGNLDISGTSTGASLQNLSGSGMVGLGAQSLTLTNANGTFAGSIAGSGGFNVAGGSETLSASNAYTGGTSIATGATLVLSAAGSIAASATLIDQGTFDISATSSGASVQSLSGNGVVTLGAQNLTLTDANDTFAGAINGAGGLNVTGGSETLTGTNTYLGGTAIAAGATLALSGGGSIASSSGIVDNGTLDVSASSAGVSAQSISGAGTLALGAQTLSLTNASGTFAGVAEGTGGITVSGGTESFSGVNTYSGVTAIGAGAAVALAGNGSIAGSSIMDDGTFDISAGNAGSSVRSLAGTGAVTLGAQTLTLTNASDTFAGTIAGLGGIAVTGGTETLSGTNAYEGGTAISNGGMLVVASDAALGAISGALSLNNGTLQTTASFSTSRNVVLVGDGALDVAAGTTLTDGPGSISGAGALVKTGEGELSLCGGLANAGGLAVMAGALNLCGIDTGTGATGIAAGATLLLSGAGKISSSSGVADDGTFDISAAAAGAAVQSLSGTGKVTLGAQSLNLTNASGAFAGVIAGTGGVALTGGTETLSGVNTYSGGTSVSAGGRLIVTSDASLGNAAGGLSLNNATLEAAASFTTARNISVTGNATLDADPGAAFMQTGQLSGSGHITKDGDGTLVLAGDNSNWGQPGNTAAGGITINDGLVEVTNSYGLGYGQVTINSGVLAATVNIMTGQTIVIAGDTALNTDADTTTTLTGTVETAGTGSCLQKTGPGTLVVAGTATLSNGMCVQDGRLVADGMLNGAVSVYSAGILRGTGVINGAVTVMGTLAPGNSPGTLTTTGTVTMTAGSTFQEDINGTGTGSGPGNYSRLLVTGPASQFIAGGAALDVNLLNIVGTQSYTPFTPQLGDSFVIVAAEGGVVGHFAALAQPAGLANGTRLAVIYNTLGGDSIDLRVVPTSYLALVQSKGANGNAQSAANALDQIIAADSSGNSSAALSDVASAISTLNEAELPRIATALAGEVHADLAAIAPEADQWLQGAVARQLDAGDGVDRGALQPGDELWLDSTASRGKWYSDAQASGFTTDRVQIAFGFDLLGGQANRLGVGFSHALANVAAADGDGSVEENMGFVYGQAALAPLIIDGMWGAGTARWDTSRPDPLGFTARNLNASPHGDNTLASAGVRWPWHLPGLVLAPYVRALWQRAARDNLDEGSTPDALSGPGYNARGVRSTAGVSAGSESQSPLASVLTYQFNVGVAHDGGELSRPVVQASLAGAPLDIVSPNIGRTFVLGSITGTVRLGQRTYVYVGVSAESRSGQTENAGINFGVRARI